MYVDILKANKWYYLFILSGLTIFFTYFIQTAFMSVNVYLNTYSETMTYERIQELFKAVKKYEIYAYLILPIMVLLKIFYNCFFISTAGLVAEEGNYSFSRNFNVCLKAEIVFIVMFITKIFFILFFKRIVTVSDINFVPFSALSLFSQQTLPKWSVYPLQTLNMWELIYCYFGTCLFSVEYDISIKKAIRLFCLPYLTGLFVLVTVALFITISLT